MSERQSGRTTQQLRDAPHGALFIWCRHDATYARRIARTVLGRHDLRIVGRGALRTEKILNATGPIILDHAIVTRTNWEQYACVEIARINALFDSDE